jgi:hypothetical protein
MALDEDLIELARNFEGFEEESGDVKYYQNNFGITSGDYAVVLNHLYHHYKKWSSDPVSLEGFVDQLDLDIKNKNYVLLDNAKCNIQFDKLMGDYVKSKRKSQKEERLRKISSSKS